MQSALNFVDVMHILSTADVLLITYNFIKCSYKHTNVHIYKHNDYTV